MLTCFIQKLFGVACPMPTLLEVPSAVSSQPSAYFIQKHLK
ncbi:MULTISPECIES: hypothetical protein [unclassified Moorena]|nr:MULTISPECIES: hypothetical protein [unclassified Moorena]